MLSELDDYMLGCKSNYLIIVVAARVIECVTTAWPMYQGLQLCNLFLFSSFTLACI